MTTSAPTRRARLVTAPRRIQRSSGRPSGGPIACQCDRARRPAAARLRRDVHLVAERGQALGHGLHVDRAAERAGHPLIEARSSSACRGAGPAGEVGVRGADLAKQREERARRTRPNSSTSSFMTAVTPTSARYVEPAPAHARLRGDARAADRFRSPSADVAGRSTREPAAPAHRSAMRARMFSTNAPMTGV